MSAKMQHCFNCGAELGVYDRMPGDRDTCGAKECEREARDADVAERDQAHEQLDRYMGWTR